MNDSRVRDYRPRTTGRDLAVSRETVERLDGIIVDLVDAEPALQRFLVPSELDDTTYVLDVEALRAEAIEARINKEALTA